MTDNKNIMPEDKKNLKQADMDKFGAGATEVAPEAFSGSEKKIKTKQRSKPSDKKEKGGVPIAVDIAVALFIVLIIAALVVGAYFAFKYYADNYRDATVQYTILITGDDAKEIIDPNTLRNKDVYLDTEDNSYYFGKLTSVKVLTTEEGERQISAKITVDTRYEREEGFLTDGHRIAVGCDYSLRVDENTMDITIVEIYKGGSK